MKRRSFLQRIGWASASASLALVPVPTTNRPMSKRTDPDPVGTRWREMLAKALNCYDRPMSDLPDQLLVASRLIESLEARVCELEERL